MSGNEVQMSQVCSGMRQQLSIFGETHPNKPMRIRGIDHRSEPLNGGNVHPLANGPVVCIHDEDEQEPQPIRRNPIISVNGEDINNPQRTERPSSRRKRVA